MGKLILTEPLRYEAQWRQKSDIQYVERRFFKPRDNYEPNGWVLDLLFEPQQEWYADHGS